MSRLLLLIALGLVSAFYFPESRAVLLRAAAPVLNPVLRWQTEHEMSEVAREVQLYESENYGQLPSTRGFRGWLDGRFASDVTTDSWGRPYALLVERDSFSVVSWGPDGLPRTDDDIRTARVRLRPGR